MTGVASVKGRHAVHFGSLRKMFNVVFHPFSFFLSLSLSHTLSHTHTHTLFGRGCPVVGDEKERERDRRRGSEGEKRMNECFVRGRVDVHI
jgi:hypothetical protein